MVSKNIEKSLWRSNIRRYKPTATTPTSSAARPAPAIRESVLVPVMFSSSPISSIAPAIIALMPGVTVTPTLSRVPVNRLATKLEPNMAVVAIATITQAR
ncbi:hypothetical protein D3C76_1291110 [compost metagenome]